MVEMKIKRYIDTQNVLPGAATQLPQWLQDANGCNSYNGVYLYPNKKKESDNTVAIFQFMK
jgi:hypothetical protein